MKKDNLLHFPLARRIGKMEAMKRFTTKKRSEKLEQKRVAITASLVSILFIMSLVNSTLLSNQEEHQGAAFKSDSRAPASVKKRNTEWEHKLASKLAKMEIRGIASVGSEPTLLEKLQYETLEGKYFLSFENGKIAKIEFSTQMQRNPNYVNDRSGFLEQNRKLMSQDFDQVQKQETKISDQKIIEKYNLEKDGKVVSAAHFTLDRHGRFLGLNIVSMQ